MTDIPAPVRSDGRRVMLLAGQAFALGLLMSWILIPASAIFLSTYGADLLPVTYLGAAVAGVVSSAALSSALRRRPLASVALRVLAGTALALMVVWLLLANEVRWLSFGLLVLVPIVVPMGFMLLVGQAGMLLDVRALKALYARVIAGFALGFVAGGLAAPPLLTVLGRTEHLVLGAAAAAGLWLALLLWTRHQFRAELSQVEHDDAVDSDSMPSWGDLLRHRYVALIVAFQMLSAVESQWLDYLVYERATARYEDSEELARFISRFTAIAYGADIVFLLLIAGLLLRRFGLRYGLTANPTFVLGLVAGVVALSSLQGAGATVVFVLIVAARVTDLVLADGAARTSLSAAYQVVPTPMRLAAQAGVEGMAVPVAIGASGAVLLVLQATVGTAGTVLPVLVAVVVTVWLVVAVLVHRSYRTNLLASLRFRALDPSALVIDEVNSLAVADGLLDSEDPRDIRLGLDTLALADHPALPERLDVLTRDPRTIVRSDALERLATVDALRAGDAARHGLSDGEPSVRAASARILASLGDASALPAVEAHRSDDDPDVRVAVLAAMAHLGGTPVRREVAATIVTWADADQPFERLLAARGLAAIEPEPGIDRAPLAALLVDTDADVAKAALGATRWPEDRALLGAVAACLGDRATARAAADALVRVGGPALAVVDERLADAAIDRRQHDLLVRVARDVGGDEAVEVLARHMGHRDREVGLTVLAALGRLVTVAQREGRSHPELDPSPVILSDLAHAAHTLRAIAACDGEVAADGLRGALRDELALLRRRVLAGLSTRFGEDAIERVSFQFAKGDTRSHALAVEWLDVTLTSTDRAAVALVEPGLSETERLRRLTRTLPLPPRSLDEVLLDLVTDDEHRWRQPWVQACAVYAAWSPPPATRRRPRRRRGHRSTDRRRDDGGHRRSGQRGDSGPHPCLRADPPGFDTSPERFLRSGPDRLSHPLRTVGRVTVIDHPQERARRQGEADTIALMGTINAAAAQLVATIRRLLDTNGWHGWGIQSLEHWVTWKAAVSRTRARGLVQIARRMHELPACWALFEQGRITEDAMVRIARRVPADHDAAVARKVPALLISQLDRALSICPPLPEHDPAPRPGPERHVRMGRTGEGWLNGSFCLPPDEAAVVENGLQAARDAEFRDRQGLEPGAELDQVPEHERRKGASWADGLVRMASEAADALDPTLQRTGTRGERNKVVLHVDVAADGTMGPGQLHLGPVVPDPLARFLACDAEVVVAAYQAGQLIGITPTARTVPRHLRRVIERRDQGCAHPLCTQRRWLHIHHIVYWHHRGLSVPSNLVCLCPTHHRALHAGDFRIDGDPEAGTVRFLDARGSPIEPPGIGPPRLPDLRQPSPFRPPDGERLSPLWFSWN